MSNPKNMEKEYLDSLFSNGHLRANYLIHWSRDRNYIYVETPKVACTTIKRTLQRDALGGAEPESNVHDREKSPLPRVSDDVEAFKQLNDAPDTFKFCFVRNPFTRVLSCYLDKFVQNAWERQRLSPLLGFDPKVAPSFKEFLLAVDKQPEMARDIHWSTQTYLLRPNRYNYSYIGRFETFTADFTAVCAHLGIPFSDSSSVKWHATGSNDKLKDYFGPEEIELALKIYDSDFRNFGYGRSLALADH